MTGTPIRDVDVAIVGAGPAGLTIGRELSRAGAGEVEILEREDRAGGVPRHSHHIGFGLRDLHRVLSGPAYAQHLAEAAATAGAKVRTGVTVTGWAGDRVLVATSGAGIERIRARVVVLATGARERPRAARYVPGDRPAGVYTTGQLQQAVYEYGQAIGTRAVIVGAEHVSYSAVLTLRHAGVRVAAMVTDHPRQQSYAAFDLATRLLCSFPVHAAVTVRSLIGHGRLAAVEIERAGHVERIECDTVVFTGDWVADHELARSGGLVMTNPRGLPRVDQTHATSRPGVFVAGNLGHPGETADAVAREAEDIARHVLRYLTNPVAAHRARLDVNAGAELRWISPAALIPGQPLTHRSRLTAWTRQFVARPTWIIRQGDTTLWSNAHRLPAVPNRAIHLPADWISRIDAAGPALSVDVVAG